MITETQTLVSFLKGNDMTLEDRINFVLSNTKLSCQEVADLLACPVKEVHKVVEKRWAKFFS